VAGLDDGRTGPLQSFAQVTRDGATGLGRVHVAIAHLDGTDAAKTLSSS